MTRDAAEFMRLRRLKTRAERSQNRERERGGDRLVALVKALARQAAEADLRAGRERENGRMQ